MLLRVAPEVLRRHPDARIGVLTLMGVDNATPRDEVAAIHAETVARVQARGRDEVLGSPHLAAWREIYRAMGTSPKKNRPSVEALARRVLSSGALPRISTVVDLYNAASVRYMLPVGAYDLDRLDGDVELRLSPGGEAFLPLGGADAPEATDPGEVVYADRSRVLTRRWNHRDGEASKVTEGSRDVVLIVEAAEPAIAEESLTPCLDFLADAVTRLAGGVVARRAVLDGDHPTLELSAGPAGSHPRA